MIILHDHSYLKIYTNSELKEGKENYHLLWVMEY